MDDINAILTALTHVEILSVQYILTAMEKTCKKYMLDNEVTPEQKYKLKRDLNFSSQAINSLTQASKSYQNVLRNLDIIENSLNNRLKGDKVKSYDIQFTKALEILQISIIYMFLTTSQPRNTVKIHNYFKKFKWSEDLKDVYEQLSITINNIK